MSFSTLSLPLMKQVVITTSVSQPMTLRPSWRLTLGTWAVLGVAVVDRVEEEEAVGVELPGRLVNAGQIRCALRCFVREADLSLTLITQQSGFF